MGSAQTTTDNGKMPRSEPAFISDLRRRLAATHNETVRRVFGEALAKREQRQHRNAEGREGAR